MKRIIILCLSLLLPFQWQHCKAEAGGRYQFELLVFSQDAKGSSASGQIESKIQWPTALTELTESLKTDSKSLREAAAKLLNLPGYQPIIHLAWKQSAGLGGVILPMHIKSDDGRLDGYLQLRNVHVLEMVVDLEYKSLKASPAGKSYLFHITEQRPTKLNEIHYFDNPDIGVLVKVSEG